MVSKYVRRTLYNRVDLFDTFFNDMYWLIHYSKDISYNEYI